MKLLTRIPSLPTLLRLGACLFGGLAATGTSAADTRHVDVPGIPAPQSLNGEWKFRLAADPKAADEYRWFFEEGYDVSAWDDITVPANWTTEGFEEPHYVDGTPSEGFYVTTFTAPEAEGNEIRALLRFAGVWNSTEAWLNGKRIGRHDSGFTAFAFDIRDMIKWGEENTLSVRVRQQEQPDLFKFDANDDWGLPGIYRDVWVEYTPRHMVMAQVVLKTEFDDHYRDATLTARVFVERWESAGFFDWSDPFELHAQVTDAEGNVVAEQTRTQRIRGRHQGNDFTLSIPVSEPLQWTAETPNLYNLTIELIRDGEVRDRWVDRIGFREVTTDGGVLRVNGRPVKLRGVARHDLYPGFGRATREEHWREDIELMKAANINTVRMAHYPHAEGFVRLCDEYGIYVINEIPLGFGGDRMWNPAFADGMMRRIYGTITRDRNRPSVIVWAFGNEDPFTALQMDGLRMVKGLDPTRPTLLPFRAELDLPLEVDILAPHYWTAEDYDDLGATSTRPIISTEYTHALGPDDFGEMRERWEGLTAHSTGAGAMIWLWADQGLLRNTEGQEVLHPMDDKSRYTRTGSEFVGDKILDDKTILDAHGHLGSDGIVDADRVPQRDYWEAKAVYSPVQVLDEWLPLYRHRHFVPIRIRNGFDFLDLSTVSIEWKLFRDNVELDRGVTTLKGAAHTTQFLELPTTAIDESIEGAHYVDFTIRRPDRSVMTEASVRLGSGKTPAPEVAPASGPVAVKQSDNTLELEAAHTRLQFRDGVIAEIHTEGKKLVESSDVVLWRPATYSERNRLDRLENAPNWNTFMQGSVPQLLSSDLSREADRVVYTTKVRYEADAEHFAEVEYTYTFHANGQLEIAYAVQPTLKIVDWIPEVGISLKLVDKAFNTAWLGEGVIDSMPGKTSASRFGYWDYALFSGEARGTKMYPEWVRVHDLEGWGLHAEGMEAFRFVGILDKGSALRLLGQVAGSWVKNGPAELPGRVLTVDDAGQVYTGSVTLTFTRPVPVPREMETAVLPHPAVLESHFTNPDATYPSCHASTIVETSNGGLVAAWFGGTRERHPDVGIWVGRFENGQWQPAVEVANGQWTDGTRYPTWNPVLFQPSNGPLQLFYKVGPSPSEWWGMVVTSTDGGRTWGTPRQLPDGILGPIKNKPVELADGSWLSPTSTEGNGWHVHFELSKDQGKTWEKIGPVERGRIDSIQPSILFHEDGSLQALCRTRSGFISETWSYDGGQTWSPIARTSLPNPGSGTDAVTLADGRQLLIYNHSSPPTERPHKGVRYPLDLAISHDGVTWEHVATLERAPRGAGYAYPAIIQGADGRVHVTYTWNRDRIKHVVLDPSKL